MLACHCTSVSGTTPSPQGNITATTDILKQDCWKSCQHMPCSAAVGPGFVLLHSSLTFFFCSAFCACASYRVVRIEMLESNEKQKFHA